MKGSRPGSREDCSLEAARGIFADVPGWRNGRRYGLKIRCPQGRAGSTPALGTNVFNGLRTDRDAPLTIRTISSVPIVCRRNENVSLGGLAVRLPNAHAVNQIGSERDNGH